MPRLARRDLRTSFFHVITQGINKEYIFNKNTYMERYVEIINNYREKYKIKIISYCIMNNHAHILIYAEKIKEMSEFMRCINTVYGKYYNNLENRVGYVFRSRYVSQPIYSEKHLYSCISYIHNNPVKANLIRYAGEYKYSSYNDYINRNGILNKEMLEIVFGVKKNYLEIFLSIKEEECEFIEYEEEKRLIGEVLIEYCKEKGLTIEQIKNNDNELVKLVKYIIDNSRTSIREMSKFIGIHRDKISKLLKL